ncbi:anaerobic sulfite reductase subunit AsrA [Cellulosilyticum sp. I15G10I2]|uniref:anaerobic sulfite reductase subunit AsrA n=1 Tax=Cellulosilyticum sp. I15G10I2 TaxID=1892843 RepID=UPI00085BDCBF|nr:anaerobic sulfite reductase subunit AsrA [Cellulosilyticum sp. I15G10I2]
MGYRLTTTEFDKYLTKLSEQFEIYGPIKQKGKGMFSDTDMTGYGKVSRTNEMVLEEKSYYSPKEIFYPIRETLFYFLSDQIKEPVINKKPIIMFLRPCDIHGIERLDKIFLENGIEKDYYYLRRRELLKFIMIECTEGFDTCFCVTMGASKTDRYEAAIRREGSEVLIHIKDTALLIDNLKSKKDELFEPEFIEKNKVKVTLPDVSLVTQETFNHEIWTEYTSRCIACGRCNTSCITCSCFTMQDVKTSDDGTLGERRRVWAGCHVDGYTDMAGGHSFRNKNGEKMRFKTMHKVNDFYKRFGMHMCVGCGRCDDVCPEYISFSKCINKLNQIVMEGQSHA